MKSQKLWHAFGLIFGYLLIAALVAAGGGLLFQGAPWWIPLVVACLLWVASLVCAIKGEKHGGLYVAAFVSNSLGVGLSIAAYVVGSGEQVSFLFLLALALLLALSFLPLLFILSMPSIFLTLYVVVSYLVWLAGVICMSIFLFPLLCGALGIALPEKVWVYLLFFLILLGFMTIGALIPADDFFELLRNTISPTLAATFFILILVLLAMAGDGDCGGDCCGGGCECCGEGCCDCTTSNNVTNYRKRAFPSSDVMSHLSQP